MSLRPINFSMFTQKPAVSQKPVAQNTQALATQLAAVQKLILPKIPTGFKAFG